MSRIVDRKIAKHLPHPHIGKPDLAKLFNCYAPALFGIISKMTKSKPLAEQILKLTFVQINDRYEFFDPEKSTPFIWMYRIARETANGHRSPFNHDSNNTPFISKSSSVQDKLKDTISTQCTKSQGVFNLVFFEGLSVTEVSERLAIPTSKVRKMLHTSMSAIRKM